MPSFCCALDVLRFVFIFVGIAKTTTTTTKGTDDKARREMKALVSRMLRENVTQNNTTVDVSKESLYRACHGCLDSLLHLFMQVLFTIFFHHVTLSSRILWLYGNTGFLQHLFD
jgi:hypothetical protein